MGKASNEKEKTLEEKNKEEFKKSKEFNDDEKTKENIKFSQTKTFWLYEF